MAFNEDTLTWNEFEDVVRDNNPRADLALIQKAYELSLKAHKGQFRKSGDPYFVHSLNVAKILVDLKADTETVCAGLLHDIIEDSGYDTNYITKEFNESVANLVDGMTKIDNIIFSSKEVYIAENLRKILLASMKDIRVLLIRLADRLHNMRTLKSFPLEKQKRIANETLSIYVPIAHKLGVWRIKGQLEDLSLKVLDSEAYLKIKEYLGEKRSVREEKTKDIVKFIQDLLLENNISAEVYGRAKYFYSIYKKMKKKGKTISQIYDLFAIRIITKEVEDVYKATDIINKTFSYDHERYKDYIANPKPNGYRSIHTTVKYDSKLLEIQLRTELMHYESEEGIAAHWAYKGEEKDEKFDVKITWVKQLLNWLRQSENAVDFIETLKIDFFENEIIVFTPKGDPISLPENASVVDFGYAIHTKIGNNCSKAKVNNKLVPLDYVLHSGDIVEILLGKNSSPSRNWLNFVKTKKARSKICSELGIDLDLSNKALRKKAMATKESHERIDLVTSIDASKKILKRLKVSKCCFPEYGKPIVGVRNKHKKISVHNVGCINVSQVSEENIVPLTWKQESEKFVKLRIIIEQKSSILVEILNFLVLKHYWVISINTTIKKAKTHVTFKIEDDGFNKKNLIAELNSLGLVMDAKYI